MTVESADSLTLTLAGRRLRDELRKLTELLQRERSMREQVYKDIVSCARRNMRAHALAWREFQACNYRVDAVMALRQAIRWRDTAKRIQSLAREPIPIAA